jgi:hypothetical protein
MAPGDSIRKHINTDLGVVHKRRHGRRAGVKDFVTTVILSDSNKKRDDEGWGSKNVLNA